jgi:Spy/CpxP family protein refolding chaperone
VKRSWISLAIAVVVLAVAAPSARAQGGPPPGGQRGPGRMMEMLLKDITLTDAQKVKVDSIQAKYAKEMPPRTPGEPPSPEAMAKRREVMGKQQEEIRAILTADQQTVFDKNVAEMKERMGSRPGS